MITVPATYDPISQRITSECPAGYRPISASVEDGPDGRVLHHYVPVEAPASTCNPTAEEIVERVRLLRVASECYLRNPTHPTDGYCGLASRGGDTWWILVGDNWENIGRSGFDHKAGTIAVRQLLAERGGK